MNRALRFLNWIATLDGKSPTGGFACPHCGAWDFEVINDPVFSTSSRSESRTKALAKCANGKRPCAMRYVFVSRDFGKSWSPYEPSN